MIMAKMVLEYNIHCDPGKPGGGCVLKSAQSLSGVRRFRDPSSIHHQRLAGDSIYLFFSRRTKMRPRNTDYLCIYFYIHVHLLYILLHITNRSISLSKRPSRKRRLCSFCIKSGEISLIFRKNNEGVILLKTYSKQAIFLMKNNVFMYKKT
jgi:hypothetical protein